MLNNMKGLGVIFTLVFLASCGFGPDKTETVVATVNGEKITETELMEKINPDLAKIEMEIYEIKNEGLDEMIDYKLVEQEAKKHGKTRDAFVEEYLAANVKEPTENEIKEFYSLRKKKLKDKKYEDVKEQVVEFLKMNQMNSASRKLLSRLRENAKVSVNLEPPRMNIEIGNSPVQGPAEAKVTIIDFSDYQCPFCGQARKTLKKIFDTYGNSVRFVFKDFPMSFHRDAQKAHEAAHCAGDQDKYWSMYELLFANQNTLKLNNLKHFAKELELDMEKFNKCLEEGTYSKRVVKNIEQGRRFGVKKAPTFFINGIMLSGAVPFSNFKEIIDNELIEEKK